MAFRARSRLVLTLAAAGVVSCLSACALVLGIDPPTLVEDGPSDATTETNGEAGEPDGDTSDGGGSGDVADAGPPDTGPCVGTERPNGTAIFTATSGTDESNCGSQKLPCKTVQYAIDRAKTTVGRVYVGAGTYTETISLASNVTVEGGYEVIGEDFFRTCEPLARSRVVIVAPSASDRTVVADSFSGVATLKTLTLRSKDPAAPSESLYGLFARGSQTKVVLDDVSVLVASGGDGPPGAPGNSGAAGDAGCAVGSGADASAVGTPGNGADAGTFTDGGYVVGVGTSGGPGAPGQSGLIVATPTCVACYTCTIVTCAATKKPDSCGTAGTPGCPGGAGQGGGPGGSGGSSVGVYAVGATVQLLSGEIVVGKGGAGGVGGSGGEGGGGGAGRAGDAGPSCNTGCNGLVVCEEAQDAGAPGRGGTGGSGSAGGQGGGGAGGRAYAVVRVANATLLQDGGVLRAGDAGASLGNGAPGTAGDRFP